MNKKLSGPHEQLMHSHGAGDMRAKHRIAEILGRISTETETNQISEVGWTSERSPRIEPARQVGDIEDMPLEWSFRSMPTAKLRPRQGFALPSLGPETTVMMVSVLGLGPERLQEAVRHVENDQISAQNFVPVFLTDSRDPGPIQRGGYNWEYFSPDIYGDAPKLFRRKFQRVWRKWMAGHLLDLGAPGYLEQRLEDLEPYLLAEPGSAERFDPRRERVPPRPPAVTDVIALRAEYASKCLDREPDTFVLYRILGNDLPPRHERGQTLSNLRFMLEHEPSLAACEKRWIVNRIVDPEQELAILALLEEHDQKYLRIPFVLEDYARVEWSLTEFPEPAFFLRGRYKDMTEFHRLQAEAHLRRHKNNYVINNNGARNAALRDGRERAKWVLPWDGNCFLTRDAWNEIAEGVIARPYFKYFTVPMARILDNASLLTEGYRPQADDEPQILFRRDAGEEFDEAFHYGRRPKVELLLRLGVPGGWESWGDFVWDLPRSEQSDEAGSVASTGWVPRLFSGQPQLELPGHGSLRSRSVARNQAISEVLDSLDRQALMRVYDPARLTVYNPDKIAALKTADSDTAKARIKDRLLLEASLAMRRGPYSVIEKTALPPSKDPHDYFHPAPYWWPNPNTPTGIPYVFKDGERVPGTRLYEPESNQFDRTRLQRLFDDTAVLALAWMVTGEFRFSEHAAKLIRQWFLADETRMNPHLRFAQPRSQRHGDEGSKTGVIEMKDLYYFLDAIRLVEQSGQLDDREKASLRAWFRDYLTWLQASEQGSQERLSHNNHGACYDLQTAAIAAYLGDVELLQSTFRTSCERILEQFEADGKQPHEMSRTQTAHYCSFNLQCWINLAHLAASCGDDLWRVEGADGRGLARALNWLLPHLAMAEWPYEQIEPFDRDRFLPLYFAASEQIWAERPRLARAENVKPIYFPHDGIMPFWMLGGAPGDARDTEAWRELYQTLNDLETQVARLYTAPAPRARRPASTQELDRKLWDGFSQGANRELETLLATGTDPAECSRAARLLARWYYSKGDFANALRAAEAMSTGAAEPERFLVRSDCLTRLGRPEEARAEVERAAAAFPHDPNVVLARANLSQAPDCPDDKQGCGYWLNRIYRDSGVPPIALQHDGHGWTTGVVRPAEATRASRALVSVILVADGPCEHLPAALESLRQQSWGNLEVLAMDISGDASVQSLLRDAAGKGRVRLVEANPDMGEAEIRARALAAASGKFVTFQGASEYSHPSRIAIQAASLERKRGTATLACRAWLGQTCFVAGWFPGFAYLAANEASLMLETETLREVVRAGPGFLRSEAHMVWLIKRMLGKQALFVVHESIPLSLELAGREPGRPTHVKFPYGIERDNFRRLAGDVEPDEGEMENGVGTGLTEAAMAAQRLRMNPSVFDAVFVGDFSDRAVEIDRILDRVEERVAADGTFGFFHWPDYDQTWNRSLNARLIEMVAAGKISHISAFQKAETAEVMVCNPYLLNQPRDGLPAFKPRRVIVLCGMPLAQAELFDGYRRVLPTRDEVEALFGAPSEWQPI